MQQRRLKASTYRERKGNTTEWYQSWARKRLEMQRSGDEKEQRTTNLRAKTFDSSPCISRGPLVQLILTYNEGGSSHVRMRRVSALWSGSEGYTSDQQAAVAYRRLGYREMVHLFVWNISSKLGQDDEASEVYR